jgi:hypothetical protein
VKAFLRLTCMSVAIATRAFGQMPARTDQKCEPSTVWAGEAAGELRDYVRVAGLVGNMVTGPGLIRRSSDPAAKLRNCPSGKSPLWSRVAQSYAPGTFGRLQLLPVTVNSFWNSSYPMDRNNGAIWAGRGLSSEVTAGFHLVLGPLSAAIAPVFMHEQNLAFDFIPAVGEGLSPFAYPWHLKTIDWPVRFGDKSITSTDPGQSYVRLDLLGVAGGIGTENMWWGPGVQNSMLMSNTAAGFPHAFLGTSSPWSTPIGRVEGQVVLGRLEESPFFDNDPTNDHQLFSGVVVDYEPRWLPGLYLGAARSYLVTIPPGGFTVREYLLNPFRAPGDNPHGLLGDNQIISIFGRWALPVGGFDAYVEWAREDHWEDLTDFIKEPDHSQAYMFGFQRVIDNVTNWLRVYGELTHLEGALPYRGGRGVATFYINGSVIQGYTEKGQLLGAWIGPGSDSQLIGGDIFTRHGMFGIYLERVRYDDDAYYNTWATYYGSHGHDVELTGGGRSTILFHQIEIATELAYSYRYNPRFVGLDALTWNFRTEKNVFANIKLSWRPSGNIFSLRPNR